MQRASEASTSWDDQLPHELADEYLKWRSNVISLKDVKLQQFFLLEIKKKGHTIKTLGIVRNTEDCFVSKVSHMENDNFE